MTNEELKTLFNRCYRFCLETEDIFIDHVAIDVHGEIGGYYYDGEFDRWYNVPQNIMSEDLDYLISERKFEIEEEKRKEAERIKKASEEREQRMRTAKYERYLQLKKEFES